MIERRGTLAHPLSDLGDLVHKRTGARRREDTVHLVDALVRRDEDVCRRFLEETWGSMVSVAEVYAGTRALAEEVVQESWVAMLRGIGSFEGRSSVRTWLFSILIRRARSVGARERRSEAVSQLFEPADGLGADPAERFFYGQGHPDAGSWALPPSRWRRSPENVALDREVSEVIGRAIEALPEMQRLVVILRDVEGWETAEIARHLDRTRNWVRVVLHRGRFKVRAAVEQRLGTLE